MRRREPHRNRWVSTERNDGMAMGAVCDWSIPSPSKPFFSLRHVQSVDKRHHPTDSLINCEMYSYLPLSYSPCPQNPSASPLLPVCKEKKQAGLHKDSFWKNKKNALPANFLFQDLKNTPSQSYSHMHSFVCTCVHTQGEAWTHTLCLKHRYATDTRVESAHDSATGLCF